jgi:hypothetical protein
VDTHSTTSSEDKQVTIAVPEHRVAEFYALYARFLAGGRGLRGGAHRNRGHRCHGRRDARHAPHPQAETVL